MGDLETGKGLNQELGLVRAGDTRWGSHYKSFGNFILLFDSIVDVLDTLVEDASTLDERAKKKEHDILIPNFDEPCANSERLRRKLVDHTTLHHYRVDVFYKIIDWQLQELNGHFNEVTSDLFHGVACMNPVDSFSSFDITKIVRMAKLYPDDFDEFNLRVLENQLTNYIVDVRDINQRFSNLGGLDELSKKLVETKKYITYPLVLCLVKLALLLLVVTATVERVFSAMKFIKNDLRNRINDELLDGCIVPYVEKKYFVLFLTRLLEKLCFQ
ncbi:uncharacterized protein LOC107807033 [Nicotiana tabacum]|uniref:Uncharacterized protein LOC107807033 n=1 Tax=Nicotiana tabacum TaxID=4097 RepID=A0AC58SSC7_TOBAC